MEEGLHDDEMKKSSRNPEELTEKGAAEELKSVTNDDVVVDMDGVERVCRICHFGREGSAELVALGCDCRGELGVSHSGCAEAWFSQKGNRLCEICGKTAKNITCINEEDTSVFMMEWNEMRLVAATLDSSDDGSLRCKRSFCNVVLGCLVVAFILPWFFRVTDLL